MNTPQSQWTNANAPIGRRIYAVGDIHGRLDLLDELFACIRRDFARRQDVPTLLIFLGDYVDRGPDSKGVVERLIDGTPKGFGRFFLKGNHEDMLLNFLQNPLEAGSWLYNGGDATLFSYGVSSRALRQAMSMRPSGLQDAATELRKLLPDRHRTFFNSLALSLRQGDYFFVHAGVRPRVELEEQSKEDRLWIRDEFLNWEGDYGAVVVHGHSPVESPENLENRIGIDTLAWQSGMLTAVGLEGADRWFIST